MRIGAFEVAGPIGRGGMATVWAAVHAPTGAPVALKVLRPGHGDPLVEARAVAALHHPNVVRVVDYGRLPVPLGQADAGAPYLVMERAEATLARRAPIDWVGVRDALTHVLRGLAHAHVRGIVHNDVKPANVLWVRDAEAGRWKIADFGLAVSLETRAVRAAGTPDYMAPEQFRGDRSAMGPWTDLFAVGCLAVTLTTGAPPPSRSGSPDAEAPRRFRVAVPDGLDGWVARALAPDPADRFRRAADALASLEALRDPPELGPAGPLDEATSATWSWSGEATPDPGRPAIGAPGPIRVPAVPERPPEPWRRALSLRGAGLGLFDLRLAPLVGRRAEIEALWADLRWVAEHQEPRQVWITGPDGIGKSHLARQFAALAEETGAGLPEPEPGRVTVRLLDDGGPTDLVGAVLALATAREAPPGAREVRLGPLPEIGALLRELVGLDRTLAAVIEDASRGVPQAAVRWVTDLVRSGELVDDGLGYRLARGRLPGDAPAGVDLGDLLDAAIEAADGDALIRLARAEELLREVPDDDPRWGRLWFARATVHNRRAEFREVLACARRAAPRVPESRLGEVLTLEAHAAAMLGGDPLPMLQRAAAAYEAAGQRPAVATVTGRIGSALIDRGRPEEAIEVLDRAVDAGAELAPQWLAGMLLWRAAAKMKIARDDDARDDLDRALPLFVAGGSWMGALLVHHAYGTLRVDAGDLAGAEAELRHVEARQSGNPMVSAFAAELRAAIAEARGDLGAAEAEHLVASQRWVEAGQGEEQSYDLGRVRLLRGDVAAGQAGLMAAWRATRGGSMAGVAQGCAPFLLATDLTDSEWDEVVQDCLALTPGRWRTLRRRGVDRALDAALARHASRPDRVEALIELARAMTR
jgi:tetratricopeptide (TPR) repeat protein